MTELFGVGVPDVSKHLANIFECGELNEDSVVSIFENTAVDGKKYKIKFYNLDAIISVGYCVNSTKATQFRIWATQVLREYIVRGFAVDDDRLKNGLCFGQDCANHASRGTTISDECLRFLEINYDRFSATHL